MTESIDEFTLCEEAFIKANSNDINPIIYIRINKGYRPKKELPKFDINKYYKAQEYFGLRFVLAPDFQYTYNQAILEDTWESFQIFLNEMKQFDSKMDEDLYKFIEDYFYQNREVHFKDINAFAIDMDEKRFSEKTKKLPDAVKRKRLNLLLEFNKYAAQLMPFIDYNTKLSLEASARLNAYFMKSKELIMFSVKYKYQFNYVNKLVQSQDKKELMINRLRAQRFFETVSHT